MGTDKLTVVATAVQTKLEANKVGLGLQNIFFGDQNLIPSFPSACVVPGNMDRELDGTMRAQCNFEVFVVLYLARIQDVQLTDKQVMERAEAVMDVLDTDVKMNNTVVFGYVSSLTPGYAEKGRTVLRAARLTWTALTRNTIGVN